LTSISKIAVYQEFIKVQEVVSIHFD